jgi:hypothetical protein
MTTALVTPAQRFPFFLNDRQFAILSAMNHRLDTPDRHAWWFGLGKSDGLSGYRCQGPDSVRERRLYRLGWIYGRLRHEPQEAKALPCCATMIGSGKCVRCGTEVGK